MRKTILITGSTDGIGLLTAEKLLAAGHSVILHGRSQAKLEQAQERLATNSTGSLSGYLADLSDMAQVRALAAKIQQDHPQLDVLINNAGIYKTSVTRTKDGMDIRFAVNTVAPYLLTKELLPLLGSNGRVVNLSSAAQAPVELSALTGETHLADGPAYAQSKLALTMWSRQLGLEYKTTGPMIVAVNPGSLLASKMVKDAFNISGSDLSIGADILIRAALSEEFASASGEYFDNDARCFSNPHADALNTGKAGAVTDTIEALLAKNA
ncbi:SDR family NAD(P)-dependent oxidoreductase [Aliamphritea spongicola]|uniref:SDR family NAD(P)-dependent oxidoreductase n=1 Tax=Aliamphritea spongicola TaxID=707589 RepID=UPI00196B9F1F|nr:SDR family NAD(P)-dependent oxidoreductase [Aliamphritea spongicola]MBN3561196.1 SDR family NAD(P)-dependent oxidoreductase [Aliamphritea spongicola]